MSSEGNCKVCGGPGNQIEGCCCSDHERIAELEAEVIRQAEALRFVGSKRHLQQLQQEVTRLCESLELERKREEEIAFENVRMQQEVASLTAENAELKGQVERLRTAVASEYFGHMVECALYYETEFGARGCTCGYDAFAADLAAIPASAPVMEEKTDANHD